MNKSINENIFDDIEFYTNEEKNRLIQLLKDTNYRYDWIEFMIKKIKTCFNIVKVCEILKICVSIDLKFTRDYMADETLYFYHQYFLLFAILDVYHKNINKDKLFDQMIRDCNVPERKDSLFK
jgi:hypothetical protein